MLANVAMFCYCIVMGWSVYMQCEALAEFTTHNCPTIIWRCHQNKYQTISSKYSMQLYNSCLNQIPASSRICNAIWLYVVCAKSWFLGSPSLAVRFYPYVKLKQTRDRQQADRHLLAPSTFPALQLQWEYKSCKILSHLVDMTYEWPWTIPGLASNGWLAGAITVNSI